MNKSASQATGLSQAEPEEVSALSGFDPSRIAALLETIAPLCAVVADYATHSGPLHEPHDRILGRIGRGGEMPPYLTWGQLCAIEDAAYALVRGIGLDGDMLAAIASAIEARSDATGTGAAEGESAAPKVGAQPSGTSGEMK